MSSDTNRAIVEGHLDALARGDVAGMTEAIADDFVQEWPQSGERVRGKAACSNVYRNYPGGPPSGKLLRLQGSGDLWVAEVTMDYAGKTVHTVSIIEMRDGKLIHETDYFGDPFPAPEWRRAWVELGTPAGA